MDFRSREHTFARDFVFCVMSKWREEWKPEGVFNVRSINSPFTDAMRQKILPLVEENRHILQKNFEEHFPGALIDEDHFKAVAAEIMYTYLKRPRSPYFAADTFFFYCLKLARFAALALCFNVEYAPYEAVDTIYKTIKVLKTKFIFKETSWDQLDRYCSGVDFEEEF